MRRIHVVIHPTNSSPVDAAPPERGVAWHLPTLEANILSAVADHSGGFMRISIKTIVLAPALVLAAACSKDKAADPSLNADLGLAAQANTARMDSISAAERTAAAAAAAPAPVAAAPARTAPRRTTTTRRASSSGSSSSGSSSASAPAPVQRTETVKNTKRDAVIGGAAGAILGAATSRDKVKGAVIGGAAGAILGGVIGNNVDVKKKPVP
jgi:outer membrane lipoprotein SlyB